MIGEDLDGRPEVAEAPEIGFRQFDVHENECLLRSPDTTRELLVPTSHVPYQLGRNRAAEGRGDVPVSCASTSATRAKAGNPNGSAGPGGRGDGGNGPVDDRELRRIGGHKSEHQIASRGD
jgi:hypothetical protein